MAEFEKVTERTGCLYLRCNCVPMYRLESGAWVLMDSGAACDRAELAEFLKNRGVSVRAVLTSHIHYDHAGNHGFLREEFGAETVMTAFDAGLTMDYVSLKGCFYSSAPSQLERLLPELKIRADRVILPGQRQVEIDGEAFQVLPLPGHAASHVGFETPDGAAYLADAYQSRFVLEKEKLFYMLDWKAALETVEGLMAAHPEHAILSHYGPVSDGREAAGLALAVYRELLERAAGMIRDRFSLEDITTALTAGFGIRMGRKRKARLTERFVRSITEYLAETGRLLPYAENGIIRYRVQR